ncbi:MAG: RIP metalloprotease RseP [Minisyncoccia bacterium]
MITLILFLVILSVLVAVHEAGHLVLAKWVGARVKEYAIGFPPRLFSRKFGDTEYSLNLTPLGGYVNIAGEEGVDEEGETDIPLNEKLASKHPFKRILVLVAGVTSNVILAWLLISITLMAGSYEPVPTGGLLPANAQVVILGVSPKSPAEKIGLKATDEIIKVSSGTHTLLPKTSEELVSFLENFQDGSINIEVLRNGERKDFTDIHAVTGIVDGKKALGIAVDTAVMKKYSFFPALYKGIGVTGSTIKYIGVSAGHAFVEIINGKGGFSSVAGPVGIGKIVGEARSLGWVSVITFAAFLSINLAIINILPFPALDGGRVIFTLFEWITGKPVSTKISRVVHTTGFIILILLMLVITAHDISQLIK